MNKLVDIIPLSLSGLKLIKPRVYQDSRGFFVESYHSHKYADIGIDVRFEQDNHSYSKKGTIRGMHFQQKPGQAKLVTVCEGEIYDVAVDIRPDSPTFGKWQGIYLNGDTCEQFFIPVGFAHGFCVVSEKAHVLYKVSSVYDPDEEKGFRFDDPQIAIQWPESDPVVSSRDKEALFFADLFEVCR
ncbi:MAG: dTDP-4-dehydrorhamnose 3,5-epimerase [Chlamydiota bacterium]